MVRAAAVPVTFRLSLQSRGEPNKVRDRYPYMTACRIDGHARATPREHASLRRKILEDLSLVDTTHCQIQVTVTVDIAKDDFMRRPGRPGRPDGIR